MTPLSAKEQLLLAGLLITFVIGSALIAWQHKALDQQLSGLLSVSQAAGQQNLRARAVPNDHEVLSISHADSQRLQELPGIGPRLAQEIVSYRQANPFKTVEDLIKVPGIGPKKLEKIRDRVKVD